MQNTIMFLIVSLHFIFRESADSRWEQGSVLQTAGLCSAGVPPIRYVRQQLQLGQHAEELELNWRGKKAAQGCDRAPVCAPLLQHSANANGNRWGTICMQINVHLDSLLKRVQRVRLCSHNTLLQWNRSGWAQITHELQKGNGAPVLFSTSEVSEDLWDSECEGNMVAVESVIRGVESGLAGSRLMLFCFKC